MHLSNFSLLSLFVAVTLTIVTVQASPLRPQDNDAVGAIARSMLGPNSNAVSWDSLPLERSPTDPDQVDLLKKRVVYNPPITHPTNKTVWTAGQHVTVKWTVNQDDIPANAKNYVASVKLGYLIVGGDGNEHLKWTLADNFPITDESVSFTLPSDLKTRRDYIIVLFGDSGNRTKQFTINAKDSTKKATAVTEKKKDDDEKASQCRRYLEERDVVDQAESSLLGRDLAA